MKTRIVLAVGICLLFLALAATPVTVAAPPLGTGKTIGLTEHELEMLEELDLDYAWSQLEYLSSLGEKTAGSAEEISAQQYVYDQFSMMSVDEVWWEAFPVSNWRHYGTTVKVVSNGYEDVPAVTYGDCSSIWGTDDGVPYAFGNTNDGMTLVAELVDVGYGTASEFASVGNLEGAIALVHRDDNIQLWPNTAAIEANLWGASAIMFYGYFAGADNPEGIKQDSVFSPIPAISISPKSAWHLQDLLEDGPVTLEITGRVDFHSEATAESVNVAAVMWGTSRADEYVVISGHIDTWWYGSNDDSSSIAAVLEFARLFSEARESGKFVNERTMVFCSVGAEETGGPGGTWYNWLVGSYEFVIAHPEIMEGLVINLNLDGVSLPKSSGRYWAENTWEVNGLVQDAINDLGINGMLTYYNPIWSWTDAWSFGAKGGASTIQMIGWTEGYYWTYHTQLDSIEIQSEDVLEMVLKFYVLIGTRTVHTLVVPLNFVPTCDWAAGYLWSEKTVMTSQAEAIDAASAALADLREQAMAANAYAAELESMYAAAESDAEKQAIWELADEFNQALIDARRIITPWTLGEGGTMGSWDVFLRSDQHSHDYAYVDSAIGWLMKKNVPKALTALESVYTMEWGKYFSRETYVKTFDDMVNVFMYWGDDYDQQQMYVDVDEVYLGLKDGSMSRADAIEQLTWIRDSQLTPWFAEDIMTLEWAWTEASGILDAAA